MKPISDFSPTPAQVLAVGDAWEGLPKQTRYILITLGGQMGLIGVEIPWADIPATFRLELVHRVYLFRDLLNKVLP